MNSERLEIVQVDKAQTKNGDWFWRVETDKGKYTTFDKTIARILYNAVDGSVNAQITSKGGFKSIVGVEIEKQPKIKEYQETKPIKTANEVQPRKGFDEMRQEGIALASENKLKSIAVGYATQLYTAEMQVLTEKAKDLEEAKKIIDESRERISETANALYNLICSLPLEDTEKE
jgi:hypothetical protein